MQILSLSWKLTAEICTVAATLLSTPDCKRLQSGVKEIFSDAVYKRLNSGGGEYMVWTTLRKNIIRECKKQNKRKDYITKYIAYCKKLYDQGLPIISSPKHFSMLVGLQHDYICRMAYAPQHFYRHFEILKSNGASRPIDEPLPDLKYVQRWILSNILEKIVVSPYAKAFVKKRGIKENARFHRNQTVVVSMDIKNFFPSISIHDIVAIFKELGYFDNVSNFIAHLCCYQYSLPQGAPTSPYLSNLRMKEFDQKVAAFTKQNGIRYTRYADDLTFSGAFDANHMINTISSWLFSEGFTANSSKTRVAHRNARQEITGIVVNEHMQVPKLYRKKIRQEVYFIQKFGLDSHLSQLGETHKNYLNHLLGKINHARYVNPKDAEMQRYYIFIKNLRATYCEDSL